MDSGFLFLILVAVVGYIIYDKRNSIRPIIGKINWGRVLVSSLAGITCVIFLPPIIDATNYIAQSFVVLLSAFGGFAATYVLLSHRRNFSLSFPAQVLYLTTLFVESLWAFYRLIKVLWWVIVSLVALTFVWIVFNFEGQLNGMASYVRVNNWELLKLIWIVTIVICFVIQLGPIVESFFAWFSRRGEADPAALDLHGSEPADVDQLAIINWVIADMKSKMSDADWKRLKKPLEYRVIPMAFPSSYSIGRVVFLTSAVFTNNGEFAHCLIAHEFGQIQEDTGVAYLALRLFSRQVLWTMAIDRGLKPAGSISGGQGQSLGSDADFVFRIQAYQMKVQLSKEYGGYGVNMMLSLWSQWFREQYFTADFFTVQFDYHYKLAELLKRSKEFAGAQPHFLNFRPYPNLRIERLQAFLKAPPKRVDTAADAKPNAKPESIFTLIDKSLTGNGGGNGEETPPPVTSLNRSPWRDRLKKSEIE